MIYYRRWRLTRGPQAYTYDGWFLLGFIPLYIRKVPAL